MLRVFGLGIGALWVFVGWRNLPRMSEGSALAAGVAIGICCWVSWWCGKTATAAHATAVAVAKAEARAASIAAARSTSQSIVNVGLVMPGASQPYTAADPALAGLDRASWIGGPSQVVEQDVLEQMVEDIGEGVEVGEYEGA